MGDGPADLAAGHGRLCRDAPSRQVVVTGTARFLLLFVVTLVALFAAELTPAVQASLVHPWTATLARISAGMITLLDSNVVAFANVVQSTSSGFAISIEAGCNGIEAALILLAAMLAFPAPWKHRVIGILAGLCAVQALNVVRVISLFYLGQWNMRAFEWAHLYLWQALIMLDVLIVWLIWVRALPPPPPRGRDLLAGGSAPPALAP